MIRNYIKVAIRNLLRHKVYSVINISGLSIGIACCLLILLFVQYELSYDTYHEKADRIYRVSREWFNSDGVTSLHLGHTAPAVGYNLKNDFPEIEEMVRFVNIGMTVSYGEKTFMENRFCGVSENMFKVFSWKLLQGDTESALKDPGGGIITKSIAEKYFGDEDPMGKVMKFSIADFTLDFQVSGVMEDIPHNSHGHFDIFMPMTRTFQLYSQFYGQNDFMTNNFGSNNWATYVLLPEGYNINNLESQMLESMRKWMNNPNGRTKLHFWKLTDIHLTSHLDSEIEPNGDITYVYIFSVVAFFVLLIACFNFMNLSTARSANRSREVGMRKVVGAIKTQLISQFLGESILTAVISMILAAIIVFAALPYFSSFINSPLAFNVFQNIELLYWIAGIVLFIGILAGSYPAFFLSSFRPVSVLKGKNEASSGGSLFRTTLVITQFAISIILIISMGIVNDQLEFIRNKKLGFDKEHLVNFSGSSEMMNQYETVKTRLLDNPNIISATASSRIPSGRLLDSSGGRIASGDTLAPIQFRLANIRCDYNYFKTFGMDIVAGRDFSKEFSTDSTATFIINETAAKNFGWNDPAEAVDKPIRYAGRTGTIIGVVKDFHFESLRQPIVPIIFYSNQRSHGTITLKIRPDDVSSTINFIENIWRDYNPNVSFNYRFVDERFDQLYQSEKKLGTIFGNFSILAIVIACLGLFGLASFTAERRTKEIGIRKVLGASVPGLIKLMSKEFTLLVLYSNIIAWPAAYFILDKWFLQGFAYKTNINLYTFLISGAIAIAVALATVSYQAIKAASANPVKSLRYE